MIPFNRQNLFGKELTYIEEVFRNGKVSGDGKFTKLCNEFMEKRFNVGKVMLTTSCTHALEMGAILADIKEGDEVIMPSYTFVSTVNAFVLRGARPVFCDIKEKDLNIDEDLVEAAVTKRTRAIVPVHYAGVPCNMDRIMEIAKKNDLMVIEDAAQGIDVKYKGKYLGTIGDIGCFSFHETKNISSGEGGAILINNQDLIERAEIIREKGTNRSQFFRGEVDKYSWVDIGSSYLPSELNAAILYAQLENIDLIQGRRDEIFQRYFHGLEDLEVKGLLKRAPYYKPKGSNHHMFYIILRSEVERDGLMSYLRENGVYSVFHYVPLHGSPYYRSRYGDVDLSVTDDLSSRLLRLPMYFSLKDEEIDHVNRSIIGYFEDMKD
jgi:dTDP-4-amino-4,6-dideoxygalactose transaminase